MRSDKELLQQAMDCTQHGRVLIASDHSLDPAIAELDASHLPALSKIDLRIGTLNEINIFFGSLPEFKCPVAEYPMEMPSVVLVQISHSHRVLGTLRDFSRRTGIPVDIDCI